MLCCPSVGSPKLLKKYPNLHFRSIKRRRSASTTLRASWPERRRSAPVLDNNSRCVVCLCTVMEIKAMLPIYFWHSVILGDDHKRTISNIPWSGSFSTLNPLPSSFLSFIHPSTYSIYISEILLPCGNFPPGGGCDRSVSITPCSGTPSQTSAHSAKLHLILLLQYLLTLLINFLGDLPVTPPPPILSS